MTIRPYKPLESWNPQPGTYWWINILRNPELRDDQVLCIWHLRKIDEGDKEEARFVGQGIEIERNGEAIGRYYAAWYMRSNLPAFPATKEQWSVLKALYDLSD